MSKKLHPSLEKFVGSLPMVIAIHPKKKGDVYWVDSPQVVGCISSGDTLHEALHNFKLALFDYFDVPKKLQNTDNLEVRLIELPDPQAVEPQQLNLVPGPRLATA